MSMDCLAQIPWMLYTLNMSTRMELKAENAYISARKALILIPPYLIINHIASIVKYMNGTAIMSTNGILFVE